MAPTRTQPPRGSITDPQFRRERAAYAASVRDSIDNHIRKIAESAPDLTAEQRDKLALLLRGHA